MKKYFLIFFIFSLSCKNDLNTLHIVLTKNEKKDSTDITFNSLKISNSDSIIYKINTLEKFKFRDTIKIDKLPKGNYTLEYYDIIGNLIQKKIKLNNFNELKITTDNIDINKNKNKTFIKSLKPNNSYTIKMKGGCVASYHGYYKIMRVNNDYFFESYGIKKRILNKKEIRNINKFEAELLTIKNKGFCAGTGRKTFTILTNTSMQIRDNTCNWNGWSNLFQSLNQNNL